MRFTRREFLASSSAVLAGATFPTRADTNAHDFAAVQRDLRKLIQGRVVSADEGGYQETIAIDNGRVRRGPPLVVFPSTTSDVAATVKYCAVHDIRLTTKSGGHGATGYCLNADGIVLDLLSLNSIRPHGAGARLTVGMGARWSEVYGHIQETQSDRIAIGGGCGSVGLGGFLLGGGFSFISRSYGLGCDNVKKMEFVSADGGIHRLVESAANGNERDLFWALRGGGGGNFGIVTHVDLHLPKPRNVKMVMGSITFPFERIQELLQFYDAWIPTLPNEMAVYGMLRRVSDPTRDGASALSVRFIPIYNGPFAEAAALLTPLVEMSPRTVELNALTLPQWETLIANGTSILGRNAYIRSVVLGPRRLNAKAVELLDRYLRAAPSTDSYIVWTHCGGNIRERAGDASCFAHRDAELVFELKSIWKSGTPEDLRANVEWAVEFFDAFGAHAQGAYLNYIDPLLEDWQRKYYGTLYERLLGVRRHWDPKGRLSFQQGIGSAFSPGRTAPLDMTALRIT